jgi:NitT/TauT family transport system substrate-binding protein
MHRPSPTIDLRLVRVAAIAMVLALTGLLPFSSAHAQTLTKIVVGGQITDDTTPILYALKAGLFTQAGLDVQLQKTTNGGTAIPALLGGSFDIADANLLNVAAAHLKGIPLEVIAPGIIYDGTTRFVATVVKKDSTLSTGADLNGRTVGVSTIGDLNAIAISDWMDTHGGNSKTIKQVELAWSDVAPALETGRIDIGTLVQPILSQAMATGTIRAFASASDAIGPRYLITGWIATSNWAQANADAARRFAQVVRDAQRYCNTHKAETVPLLAAYTGATPDTILHGGRATYAADYVNPKDIQPVVAAAFKYGAIAQSFNASAVISPSVARLANAR